jgi:hypothetical protein
MTAGGTSARDAQFKTVWQFAVFRRDYAPGYRDYEFTLIVNPRRSRIVVVIDG